MTYKVSAENFLLYSTPDAHNVQHFIEQFVCSLCATLRKNFDSKMTKMNKHELNMVHEIIKWTSKAVFHKSFIQRMTQIGLAGISLSLYSA